MDIIRGKSNLYYKIFYDIKFIIVKKFLIKNRKLSQK